MSNYNDNEVFENTTLPKRKINKTKKQKINDTLILQEATEAVEDDLNVIIKEDIIKNEN